MATGTSEDDLYKNVLDASSKRFVSDLDPTSFLDECLQGGFIDYDDYRDITEEGSTSKKNRKIIGTVRGKGKVGYERFKQYLRKSYQGHLADYLEKNEQQLKRKQQEAMMRYREITPKAEKVSDKDLVTIASGIGKNWELLAPVFGIRDVEIDRLKMNYNTVEKQIYEMLKIWKRRNAESSLEILLSMIQSIPAVGVDIDFIYENVSHPVMNKIPQRPENTSTMYQNVQNKVLPQRGAFPADTARDGVTPIQERSYQASQEVKIDEISSKFDQSVNLKEGNDQIDATADMEHSTNLTARSENAHLNSNPHIASKANVIEPAPVQVSEKEESQHKLTGTTIQDSSVSRHTAASSHESMSVIDLDSKNRRRYNKTAGGQQPESNETKMNNPDIEKRLTMEFIPPRDKLRRKCTHDGRLLMRDENVFRDIIKCYCKTDNPIEGGFGTVYISENKIPGLNIKVALKELRCHEDNTHLENSAENEKVASRIMHFAIVPLLATGSDTAKRTIWFLYPRLVMGDLYTLIKTDTERIENDKMKEVELNKNIRLRIMYHVSAAIDFLHTEIKNLRGAILHLDVKTSNIVLDESYNARLADFGVAREASGNEKSIKTSVASIPHSHGYFEPKSDTLEKSYDYYNFGVVIREMLTGKPPVFKYSEDCKDEYLKDMDDSFLEFYIQGNIWKKQIGKAERTLIELSSKCLKSVSMSEQNEDQEKYTSTHIVKEMEGVIRTFCDGNAWKRSKEQNREDDNCDMCMVNPSVPKDLIISHASNCRCPLKVCLSCMRTSYLNPLRCHSCFQEIEPIIGSKYGAVLVAGRYDDTKPFSDSCAEDVADMQRVLTSKCPLVIGIGEEFVRTIKQNNEGTLIEQKDVKSQIRSELNSLKQNGIKTIFFYYSGHYSKDDGFMLRKGLDDKLNENMTLSDFQEMLKAVSTGDKSKSVKDFIIILDCCQAPAIDHKNVYQLNACRPNEAAVQEPNRSGSLFKKLFIQALTMKSTEDDCILQTCDICPIDNNDYITIGSLNTYIGRHMKEIQKQSGRNPVLPAQYATSDVKIAYVVECSAKLNFKLSIADRQKDCSINCKFYTKICQLKKELFKEFMENMSGDKAKEHNSQVELKAESYKDILRIVIQKGPRAKHRRELCTLEQVMLAWNGKRELFVELRNGVLIKDGMVGVFQDGIGMLVSSSISENKHYKQEEETDRIIFKFDIDEVMLKGLKCNVKVLQDLQRGLLEFRKEHKQQDAELHIISPCMIDKDRVRHVREDFVCFNIHYKK